MQRTDDEILSVLSIVSGILTFGNTRIIGGEEAKIDPSTRADFEQGCELMFLNPSKIEEGITVKISTAG